MTTRQDRDLTKLVNKTNGTIQLVRNYFGHRSNALTLASQEEHMMSNDMFPTSCLLEVFDGNNNFTNIIFTLGDLLRNRELIFVTKDPPPPASAATPPPAMDLEVVRVPREHSPQSSCSSFQVPAAAVAVKPTPKPTWIRTLLGRLFKS